ncbi:MAG: M14 metallopeptidase family protein [Bacteroidota bacterium]
MKKLIFISLLAITSVQLNSQNLQSPEQFFGFKPGADRMLFTYEKLIEYLKVADQNSDRLKLEEIGTSPMGKPIYIAFFSSKENIANLNNLKEINKQLALNPSIPATEKDKMIKEGKVFVLGTLSMHSGEVGPSQSAPLIAYDFITSKDLEQKKVMDQVVYMMVPSHNPDGMNMVVNHYNKYKGTKYEGSSLPGVYHKYVGHDNNRDFIILSQTDTKAISEITSKTWFPQVMVEKHQMGSTGPRYFVPPYHDPIAENVDAELFTWTGLFGQNMVNDMTNKGLKGISQHYIFDMYWPGSTETCLYKNVIALLTEAASAKYAKPIYIEPGELKVYGKGLSEYKKSINMLAPWPGGWWRLSDIMQYEIESTNSMLKTAFLHHDKILKFRNDICVREVQKGKTEAPYYYILPKAQKDQSELVALVNLLKEHGIEVNELSEDFLLKNKQYHKGDIIVSLAQPFRAFVKEVMEAQEFPERHYTPGGKLIKPYDITSWSLPIHKGLNSYEINTQDKQFENKLTKIEGNYSLAQLNPGNAKYIVFSSFNNESYKIAFNALNNGLTVEQITENTKIDNREIPEGSFVIKTGKKLNDLLKSITVEPIYVNSDISVTKKTLKFPRIALVETYFHDMDAGWTRYVFDTYGIKFQTVRPGDFEKTDFQKNFDLVIFPDAPVSVLKEGKYKSGSDYYTSSYPPEYTKGIGKKGMEKLMNFSQNGGTIISWARSTDLFSGMLNYQLKDGKEEFRLPYSNIGDQLQKKGLYCAGSFVEINLKADHKLTYGLDKTIGVFYRGKPVFKTSIPKFDMDRRAIASFGEKNILLSGYLKGEKYLANTAGMVWMKKGKGQFILMAFSPIFRASTPASYKLLFNSILSGKI